MNVTGTESQACAPASVAALARDAATGNPAASADAAALFLGLLAQVTTTPAAPGLPAALTARPADEAGGTTDADAAAAPAAPVAWVTPFLPPLPGDPSVPSLPEPSARQATAEPLAALAPEGVDATIMPMPVSVDDAQVVADATTFAAPDSAQKSDTSGAAAIATPPRIEATGNGATHAVVRHVPVPVNDRQWPEHVGHEIRLLVERGVQAATLRLTPEHLGPVDVRIDIVNDKANVVFGAANADTRAALSEAFPKLREMFAGAGLTLGDAGVRQDHAGRFSGTGPRDPRVDGLGDLRDDEQVAAVQAVRLGLVDAYA